MPSLSQKKRITQATGTEQATLNNLVGSNGVIAPDFIPSIDMGNFIPDDNSAGNPNLTSWNGSLNEAGRDKLFTNFGVKPSQIDTNTAGAKTANKISDSLIFSEPNGRTRYLDATGRYIGPLFADQVTRNTSQNLNNVASSVINYLETPVIVNPYPGLGVFFEVNASAIFEPNLGIVGHRTASLILTLAGSNTLSDLSTSGGVWVGEVDLDAQNQLLYQPAPTLDFFHYAVDLGWLDKIPRTFQYFRIRLKCKLVTNNPSGTIQAINARIRYKIHPLVSVPASS